MRIDETSKQFVQRKTNNLAKIAYHNGIYYVDYYDGYIGQGTTGAEAWRAAAKTMEKH